MTASPIETGDRRGPLFADTGMKLGIFGFNVSSGGGLSKSPTRYEIDYVDGLEAFAELVVPELRRNGIRR
jgi:hypothetical protein